MEVQQLIAKAYELGTEFGVKILAALAVFIIGRWVTKFIVNLIRKLMDKRQVDPTVTKFVRNLIYFALLTFVVLAALGLLGIQTTSFIAVIGAAGLAIGLALQGSLANFAAGFLLILFRPFKVGDFIDAAAEEGGGIAAFAGVIPAVLDGALEVVEELAFVLGVPAGVGAGVADGTGGVGLNEEGVAVAVGVDADEAEVIAGGFALGPEALLAAAEEGDQAGFEGLGERLGVHVALH